MSVPTHLEDAFRLLTLRAPRHSKAFTPLAVAALMAALIALDIGAQWVAAGDPVRFQMYGVNSQFAWVAVALVVVALFARRDHALLRDLILIVAIGSIASLSCAIFKALGDGEKACGWVFVAVLLWTIAATWRVFKAHGARLAIVRGVGFAFCLYGALLMLPDWPVFPGRDFSLAKANIWEASWAASRAQQAKQASAQRPARDLTEERLAQIEAAQPARVDMALAALAPRQRDKSNIYVVGVAGWGEQDVFLRETRQSMDILKTRLGAGGHIVTLINNPATEDDVPLASVQNLSAVLRGVAARMDHDKDALILSLTSHGSTDGFALENEQLVLRTLSPASLKSMLDAAGIKNRVIIVSACHSGVFVPAFSDPSSVVITAAAADKTSFGCANENQWTNFGEAFFDKGLKETGALAPAFEKARALIDKRETDEKLVHSQPQIFIGDAFRRLFPDLVDARPVNDLPRHAKQQQLKSANAESN